MYERYLENKVLPLRVLRQIINPTIEVFHRIGGRIVGCCCGIRAIHKKLSKKVNYDLGLWWFIYKCYLRPTLVTIYLLAILQVLVRSWGTWKVASCNVMYWFKSRVLKRNDDHCLMRSDFVHRSGKSANEVEKILLFPNPKFVYLSYNPKINWS